jgi:hypothetical protein
MNLAYSTPSNRAAIHAAGGIMPLVALLQSPSPFVQRSAAGALKNCSRDSEENQAAIVAAGGIPLLVSLDGLVGLGLFFLWHLGFEIGTARRRASLLWWRLVASNCWQGVRIEWEYERPQ